VLARVVLAIVLVLVPSTALASVCCDDTCQIDAVALEPAPSTVVLTIAPERTVVASSHGQPHGSPALARVFRPPR
jgi:hypothetical protein